MKPKPLIVAGIMSGTSADGIDVAIVRISPGRQNPKLTLLAHEAFPFAPQLRRAVLAAMNAASTSTAELARLNWRLGLAYAEAVETTLSRHQDIQLDLIGCHGQTLYHQPAPVSYAGRKFPCTWQAGEAACIASKLQIPVVSNFRPADILAGGHGAPLVPLLDYVLFAHPKRGRVLQNIGGIANFTAIPPHPKGPLHAMAMDTGPGNMIIDALAQELYSKPYDPSGSIAARGTVLTPVLNAALRNPFFRKHPPRTAGREQFGREFAARFLVQCRTISQIAEDTLATATALTVESIARAYAQFAEAEMGSAPVDYIVSGGGARNRTLMQMLATRLLPLNCTLSTSDAHGLPAEAKEAAAFALLAWQTWHHLPGNIPSATGAARPVILGQTSYP